MSTRFEKEAKGYLEMAYWELKSFIIHSLLEVVDYSDNCKLPCDIFQ